MDNPVSWRNLTSYRLQLIAQRIGMDALYVLLEQHKFKTLYIPSNLKRSNLAEKIGEPAADALVELWPDSDITLPKPDKVLQLWRNHEMVLAIESGELTVTDACHKYDLTRQRINQIKQECRPESYPGKHPNLTLDLSL